MSWACVMSRLLSSSELERTAAVSVGKATLHTRTQPRWAPESGSGPVRSAPFVYTPTAGSEASPLPTTRRQTYAMRKPMQVGN